MAKTAVKLAQPYRRCKLGELKVRNAGIQAPILLLNYIDASVMEAIKLKYNCHDEEILIAIEKAASFLKKAKVHIKIDTGMHRAAAIQTSCLALLKPY